ncbi:xanthine dehydrogenase accessory protein XdhC [Acidiphilium sp.]|uniref:xanthine dehydrogenase accessory protein XdhC n=1 Tax=Acidiphilium sp. TaxID=527 RepID=UPI003D019FED
MIEGVPCGVRVEITAALGSSPREAGAVMLVRAADSEGSIGGGALEHAAIARARELLGLWQRDHAAGDAVVETRALGPALGQCCGGVVTLGYRPWYRAALPPPAPLFHLQLHGAGHVGRALVRVLAGLPCRIDWIDCRAAAFPPVTAGAALIRPVVTGRAADEVGAAPPGSLFLIMTHSHALDMAIAGAALRRGDARYVGLIGSATKRARFEHRWRCQGLSEAAMARLTCPIGIAGIAGKQPAVVALAVAAQLVQVAGCGGLAAAGPVAAPDCECAPCATPCFAEGGVR